MIYSATAKGPFKVPGYHDKDSIRTMGIIYRPNTWIAATVYYSRTTDDYDIVVPTVFTGLYFKANNPGKSRATEPVWPTAVGDTISDNGIVWEAVAYNLIPPTESVTSSTWVATDAVTLSGLSFTTNTTQVVISAVPAGVATFSITNHIVKSNGEADDVTLAFKVAER